MPVIPFVSPKGGCGKSTSAVLLACELSESGHSVTIIDADPNRPVARWSKRPGKPKNLAVLENVTEETIIKTIDRVRAGSEYVIVDLEGTASLMVAYAISRASLVIIPTQGSMLDAAEAVKAIRLVKRQEEAFKLSIPCAVLLTRTNAAIRPRSLNAIEAEFVENGIRVFDVRLHEREAFRAVFSFGGTLSMLDPANVPNLKSARVNAEAFAAEAMGMMRIERKVA
jgi:chromosome partitioning protein